MTREPRLVTVAHGTRHRSGNAVAAELTAAAGERLGMEAVASYVELHDPLLTDVLATGDRPAVVVPLLLSTGYHVRHDLPAALAAAPAPAVMAPPLGPHPLLTAALVERLVEAGAQPGHGVVLLAAGSTDPAADADLQGAVDLLSSALGAPARLATLTGRGARLPEVVRAGDAVVPYLLAPGYFAAKAREQALAAGAGVVADVIGPHPRVVDLIVERARTLVAHASGAGPARPVMKGPRGGY